MDVSHQFFPYSTSNNYPAANIDWPQLFPYPTPSTSNNYPAAVMGAPQHYYSSMYSNNSPAADMNMPHQVYPTSSSDYESRPRISELLPIIPKIFPEATSYDDTATMDASRLSPKEFPQPTEFPDIVRPIARYAVATLTDSDAFSDNEQEREETQEELPHINSETIQEDLPHINIETSFECRWKSCTQKFTLQQDFVEHVKAVHVNVDKDAFICEWEGCERKEPFERAPLLGAHVRQHTGDKPHKCQFPDCDKAYRRQENLKTHIRTHTGERPYRCPHPGCDKTFSNASDRAKHKNRTHTDEKRYQCPIEECDKCYTDPSSLRKHVKGVHGDDAYDEARKKRSESRKRIIECVASEDLPQIDEIASQAAQLKEERRMRRIQTRMKRRERNAFLEEKGKKAAAWLQSRETAAEKTGAALSRINESVDLENTEVHRRSVLTVLDYFNQTGANKDKRFVNEMHVSTNKNGAKLNIVRVEDGENTRSDGLTSLKRMCQVLSESDTLNEQGTCHILPTEFVDEVPNSTNFPPKIITRSNKVALPEQEDEANQEELPHINGGYFLQCRWNSCLKTFTAHEVMVDHVQAVHFNVDKDFVCEWDGCERKQAFRTIASLSLHVKRHTLEKPRQCRPQRAQRRRRARNVILEENTQKESTPQLQSDSEKMDQTIEACCSSTKPWNGIYQRDDVLRSDGSLENIEFHRKSVLTVLDYFKEAETRRDKEIVAKVPDRKVEIEAKLNILREKERKKILSEGIKQLKRMRRLLSKKEIIVELPNTSNTNTDSLPEQEAAANQEQLPHIQGATSLQCRWNSCLKTFTVYETLVEHLLTVHVNVDKDHKEFICKWEGCGQPFRTINGIRIHIGRHISDKPHRCKFPGCYSAFSLLEPLRAHVRTHIDMYKRTKNERPMCNKQIANEIQVSNGVNGAQLNIVQEGENGVSEDPNSLKRILSESCTLYEQRTCPSELEAAADVPSTSSSAPKTFTGKRVHSSPEERSEEIKGKMSRISSVTSFECGSNSASEKCTVDKVQDDYAMAGTSKMLYSERPYKCYKVNVDASPFLQHISQLGHSFQCNINSKCGMTYKHIPNLWHHMQECHSAYENDRVQRMQSFDEQKISVNRTYKLRPKPPNGFMYLSQPT